MRIISGRFKGRHLVNFKADHVRPTTDRVKESVFNILRGDIEGVRVLDLFSGTGNLGLEALSRGATFVEMVENHRDSLRIIGENIDLLQVRSEVKVAKSDVFKYLKSYKGEPFQVIFIDPPFTQALAHDCMVALQTSAVSAPGSLVVIESARRERIEDQYIPFELLDRRTFGDKSASFFKRK